MKQKIYDIIICILAIVSVAFAIMDMVTATTVGYGDLSPATGLGRVIASILMLVGIGLIGSLTSSITSFFLGNKKEQECNNDKIDIVLSVYEKLSDDEKEIFKKQI